MLCPVSVGWEELSDYVWEVGSFSWEYRLFWVPCFVNWLPDCLTRHLPQLAVARYRLTWDALALYIVSLIALDIADG